ncbi:MAG TPA: dTMP kinase [candidate division Zixibacteria bacterium]|nr:dTMP kinase [candidate division Zixibacteria bacterium]
MSKNRRGLFISFEGIDGCGKTTQVMLVYKYLIAQGRQVKLVREPGSTEAAERIRALLLDRRLAIDERTELLLYEAARADLAAREIAPALARGLVVLCDRFYDSTTAYQGFGRRLDVAMVRALHRVAVDDLEPDLTLVFDCDIRTAMGRRAGDPDRLTREALGVVVPDRLEAESRAFFERVRKGFLEIARKERRRVKVIDAAQPVETVFADVKKHLVRKLRNHDAERRP